MKLQTKLLKALLPKGGSPNFSKLLDLFSREDIWDYLGGYENGSELVRFAKHGYDDLLVQNHNLFPGDRVLVLGAYKGSSIERWLQIYEVEVLAIEPISEFVDFLNCKFAENKSVTIFPFAVGSVNGDVSLSVDEYSTSSFMRHGISRVVELVDVGQFLASLEKLPRIIELNIEGGEYDVLERIIELGFLKSIDCLIIQFHKYDLRCELRRAQIRLVLAETHNCVFSYEWIWERWQRK